MTPKVQPRVPNAKIRIEDVITKDGKFEPDKFWKLTDAQIADLIGDAVHDVRTYIMRPSTHKEAAASVRLLEALDKENPDLGLSHYVTLFKSIESGNGSALTKSYFDSLKQYDPDTFNLYLKHPGWEAYDRPDFDFTMYRAENLPKDAEPSVGVLTDKPLNNASPSATPSGVLTRPPAKLPEAGKQSELPNVGKTIKEAEANAYTGNEPPIADYDTPITSPGVHVSFIDADGKPVDLTPEEITKFKPNSASSSPEAVAAEAAKGTTETPEAKTPPETPETPKEGALIGKDKKPEEPSKGVFKKIGDWMHNHPRISGGVGGTTALGLLGGIGISQADKIAKALKAGKITSRHANEEPVTSGNVNYRVWENYNPDYLNEEYTPGKIPSYIPQDNLPSIKESTASKKVKSQSQVVNAPAPVNNATADYVRAAYNSYIPSDAGRAYQKAIYGDPLELERNRLQQQQQKWRDFVMRSGQSPAELVQRGLMPYDALQYI